MSNRRSFTEGITSLAPLALLLIFTLMAAGIILASAQVYEKTLSSAQQADNTQLALAYLTEKVHQADREGALRIGSVDGNDALILESEAEGKTFLTYIYVSGGKLREIFTRSDVTIRAEDGRALISCDRLTIESVEDDLLRFTISSSSGEASCLAALRSAGAVEREEAAE